MASDAYDGVPFSDAHHRVDWLTTFLAVAAVIAVTECARLSA